ncbi:MAG: N-terminal glutamine amidase-domain-containing protein [Benjaminiella poitrasii]|nr:MAG: N-terminal glutamine amidase-domain-containing protein [Benjaminiella poitrasii]
MDILNFNKEELTYTSNYCEENIYKLCAKIKQKRPELLDYFSAIFISNNDRSVPLWNQLVAMRDNRPYVIWDYHVILYYKPEKKEDSLIYDFDSTLSFPYQATKYVMETFKPKAFLRKEYEHCFRLIPAKLYLEYFQSNRSHMLKEDGTYIATPPSYPAITIDGESNLNNYISMKSQPDEKYGVVYSSYDFYRQTL